MKYEIYTQKGRTVRVIDAEWRDGKWVAIQDEQQHLIGHALGWRPQPTRLAPRPDFQKMSKPPTS